LDIRGRRPPLLNATEQETWTEWPTESLFSFVQALVGKPQATGSDEQTSAQLSIIQSELALSEILTIAHCRTR